jgi:glycosyltransferase involved in cell wall biosynthesis
VTSDNLPFISVIIPTYNRVELLRETVESVRNQTFQDFEIIVVNDGSSDGTSDWLGAQPDLQVIEQENRGIAASRNAGAATARGRWLAFLDHDDLWAREKLAVQAEFVKDNPDVALVAVRHVRLGKGHRPVSDPRWVKGDLFLREYAESFIHTSSVMIRSDVFAEIRGFPTRYRFADEFDVWLTIAKAHPVAYFDGPLVFIRFYESNTSHNRIGVRTDTYDILQRHYDPDRVPRPMYLRVMSDHDISFGRAHLRAGDLREAVSWFRKSVERTPFRPRSWRYYLKYRMALAVGWTRRGA